MHTDSPVCEASSPVDDVLMGRDLTEHDIHCAQVVCYRGRWIASLSLFELDRIRKIGDLFWQGHAWTRDGSLAIHKRLSIDSGRPSYHTGR